MGRFSTLQGVHAVAGLLQLGSVIAFGVLYHTNGSPDASASVRAHYTRWELAPNQTDCSTFKCSIVDASTAYTVNMFVLVCFFTSWSGLCHFATAVWGHEDVVRCRLFRVIDYAVSAPVMLIVVCITCGASDLGQIVVSACLMSLIVLIDFVADCCNTGYTGVQFVQTQITEKAPTVTIHPRFEPFNLQKLIVGITVGFYLIMWAMIWLCFGNAATGGKTSPPDFVYVIVGATMLSFSSFAILRIYALAAQLNPKRGEALYAVLSLTAKVQLSWLFFVGVIQDMTTEDSEVLVSAENTLGSALAVFAGTVAAGALLAIAVWRTDY
jgi:hypothetical protein